MYEIRPESIKTFITDRNVKLPRFQRKQTWDEKKNFQLCISLFKEYPIGVCILSVDESKSKTIRWLLDGRQRKNALTMIYDDPENIYNWAQKFIGFKNIDQPSELEEKIKDKINEYIEADIDDVFNTNNVDTNISDDSDGSNYENGEADEESIDISANGLDLLIDIIKVIHNKSKKNTGFTKPYDFSKYVRKLPYVESVNGSAKLSSKKLKNFLDEYRKYCDSEEMEFDASNSFFQFLDNRCEILDKNKLSQLVISKWDAMKERMIIIEKIDNLLINSKIGIIEVKNLSPSDSQKIFNIINSEGEKLTAVEILSAKPNWNIKIENPSQVTFDSVNDLYKRIGVICNDIVRWDLPATLIKRLGKNVIFKDFTDSKPDFEKELTLGFKLLSGIYEKGVKKEDIEELSKNYEINWNTDIDNLIYDLNQMHKLIVSFDYFKYLKSWNISIMELTSDAIALNFYILSYKDWVRKNKPVGDSKAKQFQKNCFILLDKLIYEYVNKQWRGSSDSKIANNIISLEHEEDMFRPINIARWENLLQDDIFEKSTIDSEDISLKLMKPLLYHFYCLSNIQGPQSSYDIEIDHIIPQSLFKESSIIRKDVIKDNLLNLGLLPKDENISKSNKKLILIQSQWLKDQILKYEFINEDKYIEFSNVSNYEKMFKEREKYFMKAYSEKRLSIINN